MLSRLLSWWRRKREERANAAMFERAVLVKIDDTGISASYPNGDFQSIAWPEVERVTIETNDSGPWGADVWWILNGSGKICSYPGGATGEQEALAEFPKRFPRFSDEQVILAMRSTSNAQFVCWQRGHAL
jgi:hypothetical protein